MKQGSRFITHDMTNNKLFDVIIVGGSYAGLSAAMALGRSLRSVLLIDGGRPWNAQTPHSHNFLTHDGDSPKQVTQNAKAQVLAYPTVKFVAGFAADARKTRNGFSLSTLSGETFEGKKLLFATGLKDIMPPIEGFAKCWGISVLHCPYCHGYEVKDSVVGVLADGDLAVEMCRLIHHWSPKLTLYTNGTSNLTNEQREEIEELPVKIVEKEIASLVNDNGKLQHIVFADSSQADVQALYARPAFEQHCTAPQALGCELTERGFLKVDDFHRATVPGVYAAGDNHSMMRTLSVAVASGTKAGAFLNKDMIDESNQLRKAKKIIQTV